MDKPLENPRFEIIESESVFKFWIITEGTSHEYNLDLSSLRRLRNEVDNALISYFSS